MESLLDCVVHSGFSFSGIAADVHPIARAAWSRTCNIMGIRLWPLADSGPPVGQTLPILGLLAEAAGRGTLPTEWRVIGSDSPQGHAHPWAQPRDRRIAPLAPRTGARSLSGGTAPRGAGFSPARLSHRAARFGLNAPVHQRSPDDEYFSYTQPPFRRVYLPCVAIDRLCDHLPA